MIEESNNIREYFIRDVPNNITGSDIIDAFESNHPTKIKKADIRDRQAKAGGGRFAFVQALEKPTATLEESVILEVKGKKVLLEKHKCRRRKGNRKFHHQTCKKITNKYSNKPLQIKT